MVDDLEDKEPMSIYLKVIIVSVVIIICVIIGIIIGKADDKYDLGKIFDTVIESKQEIDELETSVSSVSQSIEKVLENSEK